MPDKDEVDRLRNRVRVEQAVQEISEDRHRFLHVKDGKNEYTVSRDAHDWVIRDRTTGAEKRGDEELVTQSVKNVLQEALDRGAKITAKDVADFGPGRKRDRDF